MTSLGLLHIGSLVYLSGVICLVISLNENRDPLIILRETLRRWVKFLGLSLLIAVAVHLLSR